MIALLPGLRQSFIKPEDGELLGVYKHQFLCVQLKKASIVVRKTKMHIHHFEG